MTLFLLNQIQCFQFYFLAMVEFPQLHSKFVTCYWPLAIDRVICWVKCIFGVHNPHLIHLQSCQWLGRQLQWVKNHNPQGGSKYPGFSRQLSPQATSPGDSHSPHFPRHIFFSNDVVEFVRILFTSIHFSRHIFLFTWCHQIHQNLLHIHSFSPPKLPFQMMSSNSSNNILPEYQLLPVPSCRHILYGWKIKQLQPGHWAHEIAWGECPQKSKKTDGVKIL